MVWFTQEEAKSMKDATIDRQTHSISEETPPTPKRRHDDNENDMQDKEGEDFQSAQRRQFKRTRPALYRNTPDETKRTQNEETDYHTTDRRPEQTHE